MRLRERHDLLYLVREYDTIYRHGSAGGSKPIRSHLRPVREVIADVLEANPEVVDRQPARLPVTDHLPRALDVGPQGPVVTEHLILGLVLFAPSTIYPQHHHRDIEESYIAIAGAWSENDAAVYAPGSLILNAPGTSHRLTTGVFEPCLLAYAWLGAVERLHAPGMRFSKAPRRP